MVQHQGMKEPDFGSELEAHQVREWASFYIDYAGLRDKLEGILKEDELREWYSKYRLEYYFVDTSFVV